MHGQQSIILGSLQSSNNTSHSPPVAYLGNLKHGLGDVNDAAHLLDVVDAGLDGLGVVGTGRVEDVLDLVVLALRPLLVGGAAVLDQAAPDGEQADGNDRLLVHDIVLAAEGVDAEGGAGAEDGRLAREAAAGEAVEDALGLLLGLLGGHVARVAGRRGEGREGSAGDGRSEVRSGACVRGPNWLASRAHWVRKNQSARGLTYRQRFAPSERPL